jgi:predicted amidohydrolase YtcJ
MNSTPTPPTLLLFNGRIYTLDPQKPFATAVFIQHGRIVALSDDDTSLRQLAPLHTPSLNLHGATVTPGLVDAHCHFQWYALSLRQLDLLDIPSLPSALALVQQKAAELPAGEWIHGRGWKNQNWPDPRLPHKNDLDPHTPHHPVLLRDKSGHTAWANSLALQIADITPHTPHPEGGHIGHDPDGQPNGLLYENGINLVSQHIPPATPAQLLAAMRQAQSNCWQVGLTGLHDYDGHTCFHALQTLHRQDELRLRITKNIPAALLDHAIALGLQTDFGDEWLRIGGIKIFADGALGGQTAHMIAPYANDPTNRGIAVTDKEEMYRIASKASAHGLSVTVHAIGDKAVHDILDVYAMVRQEEQARNQAPLRHRIEHVQIYHPQDRDRLAQLQIIASMQPIHAVSDMEIADAYWGDRARYSYAWRDMLNSGAHLVLGSDFPVEPINPLYGLHAAVTRQKRDGSYAPQGWYPEQCLTMEEAVRGFTWATAVTSGQQTQLGTLTPGKHADLTIYNQDIFTIHPSELLNTQILATIIGGQFQHRQL